MEKVAGEEEVDVIEEMINEIIKQGPVLTIAPDLHLLLGHFEMIDAHRCFYVTSHPEDQHHAHVLEFSRVMAVGDAIRFLDDQGNQVGSLCSISKAELQDAKQEQYKEWWEDWQRILADPKEGVRMVKFIAELKSELTGLGVKRKAP